MMLFRLAIMFLRSVVISENPSADAAEMVASLVVDLQVRMCRRSVRRRGNSNGAVQIMG